MADSEKGKQKPGFSKKPGFFTQMSDPEKIAVFLPNWVGDAVMATPALAAIRTRFSRSRLIGVLKPYIAGLLDGTNWLDGEIFLDPRGPRQQRWWSVGARLRREHVDLAVLFPNSFHSAWVAWWGRCRRRVGYARNGRSWLLTDGLVPLRDRAGRFIPSPIIEAYNRLAEHVGCPPPGFRMHLECSSDDELVADTVWAAAGWRQDAEVVCLNPGAAFGSAKHWPLEYFAQLARMLIDRRRSNILVMCGPNERELARQIVHRVERNSVYSLADQALSLGLSKACVRRADLLVTTDSGPRHFAAAFDRPVVTLFGPTHIAWTETYHPKAVHLQRKVDCGPCQRRVCPLDHWCMKTLTPEQVFAAAHELLERIRLTTYRRQIAG